MSKNELLLKLRDGLTDKDELKTIIICTQLKNMGVAIERFKLDNNGDFVISADDDSSAVLYYDPDKDVTYVTEVEDGIEVIIYSEYGLMY